MDDNGDGGNAADDDDDRNGHDAFLVVIVFGSDGKKQSFAYFASHLSMKDEKQDVVAADATCDDSDVNIMLINGQVMIMVILVLK